MGSSSVANQDIHPPPFDSALAIGSPAPSQRPSVTSAHVTQPATEAPSSSAPASFVAATTPLMMPAWMSVTSVMMPGMFCTPNTTAGPGWRPPSDVSEADERVDVDRQHPAGHPPAKPR